MEFILLDDCEAGILLLRMDLKIAVCWIFIAVHLHVGHMPFLRWSSWVHLHIAVSDTSARAGATSKHNHSNHQHDEDSNRTNGNAKSCAKLWWACCSRSYTEILWKKKCCTENNFLQTQRIKNLGMSCHVCKKLQAYPTHCANNGSKNSKSIDINIQLRCC